MMTDEEMDALFESIHEAIESSVLSTQDDEGNDVQAGERKRQQPAYQQHADERGFVS